MAEASGCRDSAGNPVLAILDLRTENHLKTDRPVPTIETSCPIIVALLDDLQNPKVRNKIPKDCPVVTITETGNRDKFAIQYLSEFGHDNISGLLFGMRGWIKAGKRISRKVGTPRQ